MRSNGLQLLVSGIRRELISRAFVMAQISHLFVCGASQEVMLTPLRVFLPFGSSLGAGLARWSMTLGPTWPRRWCHKAADAFDSRGRCERFGRLGCFRRFAMEVKAVAEGSSSLECEASLLGTPPEPSRLLVGWLYSSSQSPWWPSNLQRWSPL